MSDATRRTWTLRSRLILMNALLLGLLGGALLYQQTLLSREYDAIEILNRALDQQKLLTEATIRFDDFRYWSMDMVVTQVDTSARKAAEARKELTGVLDAPALRGTAWTADLVKHLNAITEHMLNIFDAATPEARNQEVARCRGRMSDASALLHTALADQQRGASAASGELLALGRSTSGVSRAVLVIAVPAGVFLAWLTLRAVTEPLRRVSSHVATLATGDLTESLADARADEFGQLMRSIRGMQDGMREALLSINQNARLLTQASGGLTAVSDSMSRNAGDASSQAARVQTSSEQLSRNTESVAAAAGQMTASIREVARNAARASAVSTAAVELAEGANAAVNLLGTSSEEIGKVVKLITSIAEQTNLLALNATIEAARAGDVGRGFGVVAGEVKELARKTARATEEIRGQIEAIQKSSSQAVDAIGQITRTVKEISQTQAVIATAVEEQTATTNEMSVMFRQTAHDNHEIAKSIALVAEAARGASGGAEETRKAAARLAEIAKEQERLIRRFTVREEA